ncbi:MAG: hypothetical protein GY926_19595 [bacterium]|nr:hypothetical protein [bacterium]
MDRKIYTREEIDLAASMGRPLDGKRAREFRDSIEVAIETALVYGKATISLNPPELAAGVCDYIRSLEVPGLRSGFVGGCVTLSFRDPNPPDQ